MIEHFITNRQDFVLKVTISDCISPSDRKCVRLIREQYNRENELIDSSTSQYFMDEFELIRLSNILLRMDTP